MSFAMGSSAAMAASGTAIARPEYSLSVAQGPGLKVDLVKVTQDTPPDYRPNSNADILCIDLHEFGIEEALAWIKAAQASAIQQYGGPACIAVLADIKKLSVDQLRQISWDIEPAGAIFNPWPDDCESFDKAFSAFAAAVKENYQWPTLVGEEALS